MYLQTKSKKIFILYSFIVISLIIFLFMMLYLALKPRHLPSKYIHDSSKAQRGSIISKDGYHICDTKKLYKAVVNTKNIDPNKKELFVKLLNIYSNIPIKKIRKKINSKKGSVVLSYDVSAKEAQYLKSLAYELRRLGVFIEYETSNGRSILQGLNIIESGETREYPYEDTLTPIIGYPKKSEEDGYTKSHGVKGLDNFYDDDLNAKKDGKQYALRDVNGYMIFNKLSFTQEPRDGYDLHLNIPLNLQVRVEKMLDFYKKDLGAKEVFVTLMDSKTGKIMICASSNRYKPKNITKKDYSALNPSVVEYSFEPGSVLKPIVFSILIKNKKLNPYEIINCENGKYKIGRKTITDEHKMGWIGAEDIIVHSSNIGMSKISQRLDPYEFHQGLLDYGFAQISGVDLPYEKKGKIPDVRNFRSKIYKATASYGYGMRLNLMQLIKAYNVFNNDGKMLTPQIVDKVVDIYSKEYEIYPSEPAQVISAAIAHKIKKILIKTVRKGTGRATDIKGLIIGGKTGTAHIAEHGHYVEKYNTSFIGFVNDKTHKYTMGVTVIQPKKSQFASKTAVPVFKNVVDIMLNEGYLTLSK